MSHYKAEMYQIRFMVCVRLSVCACLKWGLTQILKRSRGNALGELQEVFHFPADYRGTLIRSSGLEVAGRPLSQQISMQSRLEAPSRSSARAVGRPTASG